MNRNRNRNRSWQTQDRFPILPNRSTKGTGRRSSCCSGRAGQVGRFWRQVEQSSNLPMGQLLRHCPAAFVYHFCALSSLSSLSPSTRLVHFFIVVADFNSSQKEESEKKTAMQDWGRFSQAKRLCATATVPRCPFPQLVLILSKSSARSGACGRRSNRASERARESAAGRPADYHFDTPFMCGGLVSSPLPPGDVWATERRTSARCDRRERDERWARFLCQVISRNVLESPCLATVNRSNATFCWHF